MLTLEEAKSQIDLVADFMAVQGFVLIGGEPFLHPDIFPIIEYACERFPSVDMVTNGTLITSHPLRGKLVEFTYHFPRFMVDASRRRYVQNTQNVCLSGTAWIRLQAVRWKYGITCWNVRLANVLYATNAPHGRISDN